MRILFVVLMFLYSTCSVAYEMDYQVHVGKSLDNFIVKVCFDKYVPRVLFNGEYRKNRWLSSATKADGSHLTVRNNKLYLDGVKANECIRYQAQLSGGKGRRRNLYRVGNDIILNNTMWLWQPRQISLNDNVKLTFNLPAYYNVSTPWRSTGKANQFTLTETPYDWTSKIAIGQFEVTPIKITGGQTIMVTVLNSNDKRKAQYLDWITQAASAIAGINGSYPVDNAQIIITPIGAKREAVPWGEVQRGGSVAAHFFVDSFRPIQQFKDDWTAAHELSHMLVPYIDRDELWLSEGMASYYQNVARGKAGMISREIAWDKLLAGFKRGTGAARTENLSNSSSRMQMYWGGAAIYLMADIALRKRSKNRQTLGSVLKQFNQCCRPSTRSWSGERLMNKFDELSQSTIFTKLYYEQAKQRRFPDVIPTLREMGIDGLKRNKSTRLSYSATTIMR